MLGRGHAECLNGNFHYEEFTANEMLVFMTDSDILHPDPELKSVSCPSHEANRRLDVQSRGRCN
jgi:hypothetical protein